MFSDEGWKHIGVDRDHEVNNDREKTLAEMIAKSVVSWYKKVDHQYETERENNSAAMRRIYNFDYCTKMHIS